MALTNGSLSKDSPALQLLLAEARQKGFVTLDEILALFPEG